MSQLPAIIPQPEPPARVEAETDRQLVATWVARHESPHTRRNYQRQAERFLAGAGRPLREVRVSDVQAFLASLEGRRAPPGPTRPPRSSRCCPSPMTSVTRPSTPARP